MNDIERNDRNSRKVLFVISILLALAFAGLLIYEISNHERWQVWTPIAALLAIVIAHIVRLYRFIKRDSAKKGE